MITVIYFTKPIGGMHEYAKLIKEGYTANNKKTFLYNYYGGRLHNYLQFIGLLLGFKTRALKWFINKCINDQINIIHITNASVYCGFLIKRILNHQKKIIVTIHDPIPHPEKSIFKKRRYYRTLLLNKHLLRIAKKNPNVHIHLHSKNQLPDNSYSGYIFSKHPISQQYSSYIKKTALCMNEEVSFLFIGRLEYYKGIDLFIKSIDYYYSHYSDNCNFTIAGRGEIDNAQSISKRIRIINKFLSDDEFLSLIKKSHIIVFPYIQATQSGVLNLALALNKPVIVNNVGLLSEYVRDKETGLLLDEKTPSHLAESYNYFVEKPFVINEMSQNAFNFKQLFLSKNTVKEIIQQLKEF